LLSGGLDSTVNLYAAHIQTEVVLALTFDYGQRAAAQEIRHAEASAQLLGLKHQVLDLKWFREFTRSSLVNTSASVPVGEQVKMDDLGTSQKTAHSVWVPNRNGIFLNIAAAFAEGAGAQWVIPGFNLEEAQTFPDNSEAFLQALSSSLSFSTANQVEVKCFTTALDKTAIVRRGVELGVRFDLVWPCYFGESQPCGRCESCQRFHRAMRANSL
jgi:7-cyano-7-deazaguanine synthase